MVSLHDRTVHLLHDLDAFVGVRVVTDDVAQANEVGAFAFARIGEDGFGRLEIRVEIAENCKAHGWVN